MALLADDDATLAELSEILAFGGVAESVQPFSQEDLLSEATRENPPDLVVIAADIGDSEGIDAVSAIKRELPHVKLVAVSPLDQRTLVSRALRVGLDGVVDAENLRPALAWTVAAVLAGQLVIPSGFRRQADHSALTYREKQALGLVVMGFTNGEIAQRLYLAESTVKSHLSSAFTKLGVRSRNEAAALLVDPKSLGIGVLSISGPPESR